MVKARKSCIRLTLDLLEVMCDQWYIEVTPWKKKTIYIMKGTASVEVFSMVMISSTFLFFPLYQESQFSVRGATI